MLSILGTDCKRRAVSLVPVVIETMRIPEVDDFFERPSFGNIGLWRISRLVHTVYAPSDPWFMHLI